MKLYFNPQTKRSLNKLKVKLPHAVLLFGEQGVGLLSAAKFIANEQHSAIIEPRDKNNEVNHVAGTISVKRIRELYSESSSKSLTKRIFIIDDADKMSQSAQNAFLKLLEEPVESTHFVLTSHSPSSLLATIKSRVEHTSIRPIDIEQSRDLVYELKLQGTKATQALFVAAGKPAELARIAKDETYFNNTVSFMTAAKAFVGSDKALAAELAFSNAAEREDALKLLQASRDILMHTAKRHADSELIAKMSKLNNAYDAITANGNVKLQLMTALL